MPILIFVVAVVVLIAAFGEKPGTPSRTQSHAYRAMQANQDRCKTIVNGMDGGMLTVRENSLLYRNCLEMGADNFRRRFR